MDKNQEQYGIMTVRVRSGFGIFPIENAQVTVTSEDKENSFVAAQASTDESGNTAKLLLRVTGENDKGDYEPQGQKFTVEVKKEGYQTVIVHGISVYPGVETLTQVNLAALPDKKGQKSAVFDSEIEYSEKPANQEVDISVREVRNGYNHE